RLLPRCHLGDVPLVQRVGPLLRAGPGSVSALSADLQLCHLALAGACALARGLVLSGVELTVAHQLRGVVALPPVGRLPVPVARVARQILAEALLDTAAGFLAKHGSVPPAGIRAPPACQRCWQHGPTNAAGGGACWSHGRTRRRRPAARRRSWSW